MLPTHGGMSCINKYKRSRYVLMFTNVGYKNTEQWCGTEHNCSDLR